MRVIKSKSALKLQTVIRLIKGVKVIRVRLTYCKQAAHEAKPPQPNIEHRHIFVSRDGMGFQSFYVCWGVLSSIVTYVVSVHVATFLLPLLALYFFIAL